MLSSHRGLGHDILIGVFLRVVYVSLIIFALVWIFNGFPHYSVYFPIIIKYQLEIESAIFGLFVSNLFHIVLDAISTSWKMHHREIKLIAFVTGVIISYLIVTKTI
jgi:uncharacterized metal-binding protein